MATPILETKSLTKQFDMGKGKTLTACHDVSLTVEPGETVGLVGESGCGKSTFARVLLKLMPPTSGQIFLKGKDITNTKGKELREERKSIQMVFQDPSKAFSPKMRVRDILCEPLLNFGLINRNEREDTAARLLETVDLPADFMYRFPHSMSGGQRQRVGVARALALNPELVILDEATSALDVSVQDSLLTMIEKLQEQENISILFICHDLALVREFCDRAAVMYLGNIVETMPAKALPDGAMHPYTKSLIASIFDINMDFDQPIQTIKGEIPSAVDLPKGCPFQDRCPQCQAICRQEKPQQREIAPGHICACHLV